MLCSLDTKIQKALTYKAMYLQEMIGICVFSFPASLYALSYKLQTESDSSSTAALLLAAALQYLKEYQEMIG